MPKKKAISLSLTTKSFQSKKRLSKSLKKYIVVKALSLPKKLANKLSALTKTATINFYSLEDVFFVDLPGYGYAKVAKSEKERWGDLIEGYLNDDRQLALVFQLIDFRHPPTKDDIMMVDFLIDSGIPFVVVLTKADKLSKKQRAERREGLLTELPCAEDITIIEFSAQTGEGVEDVRSIIEELAESEDMSYETGEE